MYAADEGQKVLLIHYNNSVENLRNLNNSVPNLTILDTLIASSDCRNVIVRVESQIIKSDREIRGVEDTATKEGSTREHSFQSLHLQKKNKGKDPLNLRQNQI